MGAAARAGADAEAAVFDVVTVTLNPAIDQTITIPHFAAGIVNRVRESQSNAGGKGVNVASILSDYGLRVAVTGFLGQGNPVLFEALFARKRIADCFVRIAGETRVGVKIADPVLQQTTDINFPGQAPVSGDVEALFARLQGLAGRWYVLAGSIPPGVSPGIYHDLVRALGARGSRVLLDTSGEALARALDSGPDIIKPNLEELEALLGRPLGDRRAVVGAARELLARGLRLVVVSLGGEGALFVAPDVVVAVRPPEIAVQSTVGAGDALVAGVIAGQLQGLPLGEAACLATAFALDALSHIGSGLSSLAALEGWRRQVVVEEVAVE